MYVLKLGDLGQDGHGNSLSKSGAHHTLTAKLYGMPPSRSCPGVDATSCHQKEGTNNASLASTRHSMCGSWMVALPAWSAKVTGTGLCTMDVLSESVCLRKSVADTATSVCGRSAASSCVSTRPSARRR